MPPNWGRTTFYNGIRMRSRLEASFAAWMDQREWPWRYEPSAFATTAGQYLPDFLVETRGERFFLEVKPTQQHATSVVLANGDIIVASDPTAHFGVVIPSTYAEWELITTDDLLSHDLVAWIEKGTLDRISTPELSALTRVDLPAGRGTVWLPRDPEIAALLAIVHHGDVVETATGGASLRALFNDPLNLAVHEAVIERRTAPLSDVLDGLPSAVAELLLKLSVAMLDGDPEDAIAGLVREAARRAVLASTTVIPVEVHQALIGINEPATRDESIVTLLAWLKARGDT